MKFFSTFFKVFVALVSLSHVGNAVLNNISFRNITKQFKPEYQYLSPTVGKAALERGLIYNLRFFGLLTPGIDSETGRRLYTSDEGHDALMRLLIVLFPSSSGELASSSLGASNFGRYATPKMVAMLLNYAHACREEKKATSRPTTPNEEEKYAYVDTERKVNTESETMIRTEDMKTNTLQTTSRKTINPTKYTNTASKKQKKENESDSSSDSGSIVDDHLLKKLLIDNEMGKGDARKVEKAIFANIKQSIDAEIAPLTPYPAYTTEQIILAFFCHKFNTQGDLWDLLNHLNPALLNITADFGDNSIWDEASLIPAASIKSATGSTHNPETLPTLDIDSIFAINFINPGAPLPYKPNMYTCQQRRLPLF